MAKAAREALHKISETLAVYSQKLSRKQKLRISTSWLVVATVIGVTFYIVVELIIYRYIESVIVKNALNDAYEIAYDEKARVIGSYANRKNSLCAQPGNGHCSTGGLG